MRISLLGTGFRKAPMGGGSFAFRLFHLVNSIASLLAFLQL